METSLHRQLKEHYADDAARIEVRLGRYRIDVVRGAASDELVEIQHGGLAAIRDKIRALLDDGNRVLVVKPIVVRKQLIKRASRGGKVVGRRLSPKRGSTLDLFDDLVHFTRVFPHKKLAIETPLVEVEELRYPGHGRRRRWRQNDFEVEDQRLTEIQAIDRFRTAKDLLKLLPKNLPRQFDTADLAKRLRVDRSVAQRIAFCLRETNAVKTIGKRNRAWLYELPRKRAA